MLYFIYIKKKNNNKLVCNRNYFKSKQFIHRHLIKKLCLRLFLILPCEQKKNKQNETKPMINFVLMECKCVSNVNVFTVVITLLSLNKSVNAFNKYRVSTKQPHDRGEVKIIIINKNRKLLQNERMERNVFEL